MRAFVVSRPSKDWIANESCESLWEEKKRKKAQKKSFVLKLHVAIKSEEKKVY